MLTFWILRDKSVWNLVHFNLTEVKGTSFCFSVVKQAARGSRVGKTWQVEALRGWDHRLPLNKWSWGIWSRKWGNESRPERPVEHFRAEHFSCFHTHPSRSPALYELTTPNLPPILQLHPVGTTPRGQLHRTRYEQWDIHLQAGREERAFPLGEAGRWSGVQY